MNIIFSILFFSSYLHSMTSARPSENSSERLAFTDLVKSFGYTGESHYVTTVDGYILRVDRITSGPSSSEADGKPVVFLQHGITGASEHFVFWERDSSLAYSLVDAGYDVWLGNNRGNTNSRNHTSLSPESRPFWNFTINDLAIKDLPAMIDYVLTRTSQQRLVYIGHSCGTTISYILLSELPAYNEKMNLVVSLAPVALWNPANSFFLSSMASAAIEVFRVALDANDYVAEVFSATKTARSVCNFWNQAICLWLLNTFLGHPTVPFTDEDFKYVSNYVPAGTSLKLFNHFRQNMVSGNFANYDYGDPKINKEHYGQEKPPVYDTTKITVPVALFYSYNDPVASEESVRRLSATLPRLLSVNVINAETFSHTDYFYHGNAKELFINKVLQLISMSLKHDINAILS